MSLLTRRFFVEKNSKLKILHFLKMDASDPSKKPIGWGEGKVFREAVMENRTHQIRTTFPADIVHE